MGGGVATELNTAASPVSISCSAIEKIYAEAETPGGPGGPGGPGKPCGP